MFNTPLNEAESDQGLSGPWEGRSSHLMVSRGILRDYMWGSGFLPILKLKVVPPPCLFGELNLAAENQLRLQYLETVEGGCGSQRKQDGKHKNVIKTKEYMC